MPGETMMFGLGLSFRWNALRRRAWQGGGRQGFGRASTYSVDAGHGGEGRGRRVVAFAFGV